MLPQQENILNNPLEYNGPMSVQSDSGISSMGGM